MAAYAAAVGERIGRARGPAVPHTQLAGQRGAAGNAELEPGSRPRGGAPRAPRTAALAGVVVERPARGVPATFGLEPREPRSRDSAAWPRARHAVRADARPRWLPRRSLAPGSASRAGTRRPSGSRDSKRTRSRRRRKRRRRRTARRARHPGARRVASPRESCSGAGWSSARDLS